MAQPLPGQLAAWLDHGVGPGGARSYLRRVQARLFWVPREAIELASEHYQVSFASLYEGLCFEPGISLEPRGERVIEVCQGLSCREVGSQDLLKGLERLTGVKAGQTSPDGKLSLLAVPCFGRCAIGANARLDGRFCHNLAPDQAAELLQGRVTDG